MPISDYYSYRGLIHLNPYSYATPGPIVTPLRPHALRYGGKKYLLYNSSNSLSIDPMLSGTVVKNIILYMILVY